ncbi:uncharacterized protein LOC124282794 [Haliotis rubra]|uniref:uncharacterized protein LOC124282794 n=1 Tax=Haliotis rubra TaxID=36100 RepID=UPI001EE59172|nr:uncharacterized protein LOC124282794 [Haliotis rubra]
MRRYVILLTLKIIAQHRVDMALRDASKIEELLELYEEEDLLWNTTHEHYYRKDKRRQALNRISAMLGINAVEINKKITNLRTYYSKEVNKMKRSKAKGSKGDDLFVSKWEHFKTMDRFLYPFIQGRKHMDLSEEDDSGDLDDETATNGYQSLKLESPDVPQQDDTTSSSRNLRKRRCLDEGTDESSRTHACTRDRSHQTSQKHSDYQSPSDTFVDSTYCNESPSQTMASASSEDREDVFGRHVSHELRLITDLKTRQLVKLKIQNILFEGQFGSQSAIGSSTDAIDNSFQVLHPVDEHQRQIRGDNFHAQNFDDQNAANE